MKRSIIAAISFLFVATACLAEISGERPVSLPAYEPPLGYQYNARGASDGHGFLVVWVDDHRGRGYRYNPRMYATRISESGQVLDPLGIRIPTLTPDFHSFNVVHLGDSYLICWNEGDISAPGVMGVRVSSDGTILDPTPRIFADRGSILDGGTASDGNRAVIVYTGPAGNLMTVVLDRDANVVAGPKPLTNPAGPSGETAIIASNGHGFLVIHSTDVAARATVLDANGTAVSTTPAPTGRLVHYRFLVSDGDSYAAIRAYQTCCDRDFTSQHFGAKGEVLEAASIPFANLVTAIAYVGGSYLAMEWHSLQYGIPDTIGFRRLTKSGQPGDYVPFAKADNWSNGLLVWNGSSAFACNYRPLKGSLVDVQTLAVSEPKLIVTAATAQHTPDAAMSGANMAIVWNERDGVYAGRLTFDGQLLDGRGIRIGGSGYQAPRIVFDGTNYVIGWIEEDGLQDSIKLARLSPATGVVLDPGGVTFKQLGCSIGDALTLARGAETTLVAWSDCYHVVANTVDEDLTPGKPTAVTSESYWPSAGTIVAAWSRSGWLIAWETWHFQPESSSTEISAARLSPQLAPLDIHPIAVSNTDSDNAPHVASDGNGFLVAWTHSADEYGSDPTVLARRIAADGALQPSATGALVGHGAAKSVAWDGVQYDVAFTSMHDVSTLYVTRVSAQGSFEDFSPLAVMNDRSEPDASLIVTGPGRVAVAYTRIDSDPEYGDVERVFVNVPHLARGRASR